MDEYISKLTDLINDHKFLSGILGGALLLFFPRNFLLTIKVILIIALLAGLVFAGVNLAQKAIEGRGESKRPSQSMRVDRPLVSS